MAHLQISDASGECRRSEPLQPVLPGHPDPAGPPGRGTDQHHRPNGQRDQPAAALGGELGAQGEAPGDEARLTWESSA
jgi:hypothetical protein